MMSPSMALTAVCERFPDADASTTMANSAYTPIRSLFTRFMPARRLPSVSHQRIPVYPKYARTQEEPLALRDAKSLKRTRLLLGRVA